MITMYDRLEDRHTLQCGAEFAFHIELLRATVQVDPNASHRSIHLGVKVTVLLYHIPLLKFPLHMGSTLSQLAKS